jgi:protein-histidine pros-kinase
MPEHTAERLVDIAPDALLWADAQGTVRSWNAAAARIFGRSAAEAIGAPLTSLLGSTVWSASAETHDWVATRADGERLALSGRRQRAADGSQVLRISDVTLTLARQAGELIRTRHGALFDALPDAVVAVDGVGRIVFVNAQAETLFGHAAGGLVGRPVEVLLPPRVRASHLPLRSGYLDTPRLRPMGQGMALSGLHADGREFPVAISLSPMAVDGQRFVVAAVRDISDLKAIERTLQLKNEELERASRAKDHFLATMSHELRTPLNAILGFTGLMLMRLPGPLTETQERHLQHVQAGGRHLLSLINDLLDLAKIESGRVELAGEDLDVNIVVAEVAESLRPAAQAKGLALQTELPPVPTPVRTDRRALHQVVLNLAGNAVKFTVEGRVCLRVHPDAGGGHWQVDVEDTGIGIDAADQARLFQAFVQVGERLSRRTEGTGLGLHLSRKLAELMGGTLDLRSTPGEGSCFMLRLPREGPWH